MLAYGASLCILVIQMMWFYGHEAVYLALMALHAALYGYMVINSRSLSGHRFLLAIALGGLIIGTMPYLPVMYIFKKLLAGGELSMTTLTYGLPKSIRMTIELGFIPTVQTCLAWIVLRFGSRNSLSAAQEVR